MSTFTDIYASLTDQATLTGFGISTGIIGAGSIYKKLNSTEPTNEETNKQLTRNIAMGSGIIIFSLLIINNLL